MTTTRIEHDLLGDREVPADRYVGIQTLRAVENFAITGITIAHYPRLIKSLAYIKKAAASPTRNWVCLTRDLRRRSAAPAHSGV
jgi:aspartate ammonia-lyase